MEQYPETLRRRHVNAAALSDRLSGIEGLRVPAEMPGRMHVWHQYTVLLDEDAPVTRNDVIAHLDRAGIGTGIYYPRVVFDYDCYRAASQGGHGSGAGRRAHQPLMPVAAGPRQPS